MSDAAEPFVGKPLSERSYAITENLLRDYYNGLRLDAHADALADFVPTSVACDAEGGYFNEIAFPNHIGHLWMKQEWESHRPVARGGRYTASGSIRDIYPHRNRMVVEYEADLRDASGALMVRTRHHQSFLREAPADGEVRFRDAAKKPGARKFDIPEGEPFGDLERTITLEMCGEYFHGDANYHTDKAASAKLGFRDVVVGGRMTLAYAAHVLEQRFGFAWWRSGRLAAKFTNPVWPTDTIRVRGVAKPACGERAEAFVWITKADDTVVLVADASVDARQPHPPPA